MQFIYKFTGLLTEMGLEPVKSLLINVVAVQDSCTFLFLSNNENKCTIYLSSYNWYSKISCL